MKQVSASRRKVLQRVLSMFHESGRNDGTIMMLDMDEWYLLFQPLFEDYFESIKIDQRNDSVSAVLAASGHLFFEEKRFFQSVDIPRSAGDARADEKDE